MRFKSGLDFISGDSICNLVDFSFGDRILPMSCPQPISLQNVHFQKFLDSCFRTGKTVATLFVDNNRLMNRSYPEKSERENDYRNQFKEQFDLINLCAQIPDLEFIIFCNYDDSHVGVDVRTKIPLNVKAVVAPNAVGYGDRLIAAPYGLQRKLFPHDDRNDWLAVYLTSKRPGPEKLVYLNFNFGTNTDARLGIAELFKDKPWATVASGRLDFLDYIRMTDNHYFVVCPQGNAIDCHRNWEVLYLNRYPIMIKDDYLVHLYEGYPVLFVNHWSEVTEALLRSKLEEFRNTSFKSVPSSVDFYTDSLRRITAPS